MPDSDRGSLYDFISPSKPPSSDIISAAYGSMQIQTDILIRAINQEDCVQQCGRVGELFIRANFTQIYTQLF